MTTTRIEDGEKIMIETSRSEYFRTKITLDILGLSRKISADGSLLCFSERIKYMVKSSGETFYAETGDTFKNDSAIYILTKSNGEKIGEFDCKSRITKYIKVHFAN